MSSKPVGKFTVLAGKTINDVVYFHTGLPDGEYTLYSAPQPSPANKNDFLEDAIKRLQELSQDEFIALAIKHGLLEQAD